MTPMYPSRSDAARMGLEAVQILTDGGYVAPSGRAVKLGAEVERARRSTVSYPPTKAPPAPVTGGKTLRLEAVNGSSLAAAKRLVDEGCAPAVLNFASAKHPGGGFRTGARAQEESLCRASALFACLEGDPMYSHHEAHRDPLYTSWAIYSPLVPVFRGDDHALLEVPWRAAFITAAAPNAKVVLERQPGRRGEVSRALEERVRRVLAIAAGHGHEALVLGAWGCGVFGNEPAEVAQLFDEALRGAYAGRFSRVVFAVLDSSPEQRFLAPFAALATRA